MAIQFILGAGGTGKTSYMLDEMIAKSMEPEHPPILFVLPEQSNMAAEQEMVSRHPKGGTMEIAIVSFTRLAFQVFDELGVHTRDVLDDYGKSMLVMKLLKEHEKEFSYYGSMVGKQGFVDEMKSVLSEFFQYQITEEVLSEVIATLSPEKSLYHKLSDLQIVLHAFNEEMGDSYMVAEQLLSLLAETAGESKLLRKAHIYFDGFTGFTSVQYDVIEAMIKAGCTLYFSFTMDEELFGKNVCGEHELFASGRETVDRLCKLAEKHQVAVLPHVGMNKNYRLQQNPELLHLERQIFRFPVKEWRGEPSAVRLLAAKDVREEALFVAQTIKYYVMHKGYHYRDFAVVTGDIEQQSAVWQRCMEQMEVPYFLDYSEMLSHNPVVEIIAMVMELFRSDFSYAGVFAFLKTGFLEIPLERIYVLENYCLKYGVKGYSWWSKAFRGGVKGLHDINETREQFMSALEKMAPVFLKKKAPSKEYIVALYDFMSTNRMAERLMEKSIQLEEEGRLREAKAYGEVYDKWIAVMDKTMDILGEEVIERDTFMEVLMAGISDMRLGVIPSTINQVTIGDMERTRLHHVKVLFVAGANDGLLPKPVKDKGILADRDRRQLKEHSLSLAPDSREEMYLQQLYMYIQITQPDRELFISYRLADDKGAELRPSYFIGRIKHIFSELKTEQAEKYMDSYLPAAQRELASRFAAWLVADGTDDSSVYQILRNTDPQMTERILEGYYYHNQCELLDRAIVRKLYGEHMVHSVSRLETYVGCAYQFFLRYGLRLARREEYRIEAANIGSILHGVMEVFFTGVKNGEFVLESMTAEERDRQVEQITLQQAQKENDTIFESSFRSRHQLEVLIRIAKRSIGNLCRHLEQGNMQLAYFEKYFSPEDKLDYIRMALSEDMQMELKGIVDRVDIQELGDKVYVKVIDYKSGEKDIDYVKMYEGKQLQLTVYMSVMLELLQKRYPDKEIIPTGMYYFRMHDSVVEGIDEEEQEKQRIAGSRLTGLVNEQEESRMLMDNGTGTVIPVRYTKNGKIDSRTTSMVTTKELEEISDFVRMKMIETGEKIVRGQIPMNPEKGEVNSPCNFCDFQSICRFEPGLGGNSYRIGSRLDKGQAKDAILKKTDESGGEEH